MYIVLQNHLIVFCEFVKKNRDEPIFAQTFYLCSVTSMLIKMKYMIEAACDVLNARIY